jgi:alpha-tubulin suppressor-like RCC1 family protein
MFNLPLVRAFCALNLLTVVNCQTSTSYSASASASATSSTPSSSPIAVAVAVIAEADQTFVLTSNGSVVGWGSGAHAALGYGNTDTVGDSEETLPYKQGFVNTGVAVVQIAAGGFHTCGLVANGSVLCWGDNEFAQLGYGHTNSIGGSPSSLPYMQGFVHTATAFAQIEAASTHTCGLTANGSVMCWGDGREGRLGYGSTTGVGYSPATLPYTAGFVNTGTSFVQITAGGAHTCGLTANGSVMCWGSNFAGSLGYVGIDVLGWSPSTLPYTAGFADTRALFIQITAGSSHTCGLVANGSVMCWGYNAYGQLGYGSTDFEWGTPSLFPHSNGFVSSGVAFAHISTGWHHTCGLTGNGSVMCGGWGLHGQLGYGNTSDVATTSDTLPYMQGFVNTGVALVQIATGSAHTCGVTVGGCIMCWGRGYVGELGYGSTANVGDTPSTLPYASGFVSWLTPPSSASPSSSSSSSSSSSTPSPSPSSTSTSTATATAAPTSMTSPSNTPAVTPDRTASSSSSVSQQSTPTSSHSSILIASSYAISAARRFTVALTSNGSVVCWGLGDIAQLGYGIRNNVGDTLSTLPYTKGYVNTGSAFTQAAGGGSHSCGLTANGSVRCWGTGSALGYGTAGNEAILSLTLPYVAGYVNTGTAFVQIAVGGVHTCGLTVNGSVMCWGYGNYGVLGYGSTSNVGTTSSTLPYTAGFVNTGTSFIQITAGENHNCGLTANGSVMCWGTNYHGPLGYVAKPNEYG